jgi:hypothetical protein
MAGRNQETLDSRAERRLQRRSTLGSETLHQVIERTLQRIIVLVAHAVQLQMSRIWPRRVGQLLDGISISKYALISAGVRTSTMITDAFNSNAGDTPDTGGAVEVRHMSTIV